MPNAAQSARAVSDPELARRIVAGELDLFEVVMRRHNASLFRVARAILRDDGDAEDALQDAYLRAFRRLADYRGGAALGTWLTRIVINESLGRLRRSKRDRVVVPFGGRDGEDRSGPAEPADDRAEPAPQAVFRRELRTLIERRLDDLPVGFRVVFVLREVEGLSVEETSAALAIPAATVRSRLFRARALLRESLAREIDHAVVEVFGFAGARCDRVVRAVLSRLSNGGRAAGNV